MQEVENESSLETGGWLNIRIIRALDTEVTYLSGNAGQEKKSGSLVSLDQPVSRLAFLQPLQ